MNPLTEMRVLLTTSCSKAHCSQHSGGVLLKGLIGVFAALQTPLAAVCHAANIIKQQMTEGVIHHGIESEVPLLHVLLPQRPP